VKESLFTDEKLISPKKRISSCVKSPAFENFLPPKTLCNS